VSDFRVLLIYPNQRAESLVPPSIAMFSRLLKDHGYEVDLFDSSFYDLDADDYIAQMDSSGSGQGDGIEVVKSKGDAKSLIQNCLVRPYESKADSLRKHEGAVEVLTRKVEGFQPHLIAVTSTESTVLLAMQLLKAVRHHRIPTILGGVFATFAPERAIDFHEVDMICVGEGEVALLDLCERMRAGESYDDVTNLWIKKQSGDIIRNPITKPVDVDKLPTLDIEIFEEGRYYSPMYGKLYRMLPVETHRGCPYTCSYCNSPSQDAFYKEQTGSKYFRKRSMEKVRKDILYFRDVLKMNYVNFWADTFFAYSSREFDAFCEMYSEFRLPFWCCTRPETITPERIKKLQDVGLHMISFGLEHGNEQFRRDVVKRPYPNSMAIEAFKVVKKAGVHFSVNNIIGFPCETRELANDTIKINRRFEADQMSCSIFQPYYGTPLRKVAVDQGYLDRDTICPANSGATVMDMPGFTSDQLKGLRRTFAMYVKFPKSRWEEIRIAEQFTPEGDKVWENLQQEFIATFFSTPETDITEKGGPIPVAISESAPTMPV
jgi:hypothetical protein